MTACITCLADGAVSGSASLDWRSAEELPKLTPEEHQYVREWLEADEFPETEALIAAVDEGFRNGVQFGDIPVSRTTDEIAAKSPDTNLNALVLEEAVW